jgi:hypothetical protein
LLHFWRIFPRFFAERILKTTNREKFKKIT